jgi:hypothetical protein
MGWQERLRQMALAGGVLISGCGGEGLGTSGTGGSNGTGGAAGAAGTGGAAGAANTGGTLGTGGNSPFPCGNANPDPCICGRPDASSGAATACGQKTACEAAGGVWNYSGVTAYGGYCERDGGTLLLDGATPKIDGGSNGGAGG